MEKKLGQVSRYSTLAHWQVTNCCLTVYIVLHIQDSKEFILRISRGRVYLAVIGVEHSPVVGCTMQIKTILPQLELTLL